MFKVKELFAKIMYSAVHNSGATLQKHSFFGFQV